MSEMRYAGKRREDHDGVGRARVDGSAGALPPIGGDEDAFHDPAFYLACPEHGVEAGRE